MKRYYDKSVLQREIIDRTIIYDKAHKDYMETHVGGSLVFDLGIGLHLLEWVLSTSTEENNIIYFDDEQFFHNYVEKGIQHKEAEGYDKYRLSLSLSTADWLLEHSSTDYDYSI